MPTRTHGDTSSPASAGRPIRVAVVEDQGNIRKGISVLLDGTPGFRCTGSYESMEEALPPIERDPPDVVLVDIGLPGMSGIEGIRLLRDRHPKLLMLVLSVYDDDDRIFRAICAGACGYLLKNTPPAGLLDNVREAVAGGAPMSPEVARRVIELFRTFRPAEVAEHDLTPHELRLLRMLVEGHNRKTAAAELHVSVNTVAFHLKHIYEKLHVHSRSEAVAKALRDHLVE